MQIGVDVKAQNIAPGFFEVLLTIHAEAKSGTERVFLVELVYGAVTTMTNVPEAEMPRALLVETPRLLFPFARAIIANATREGGFMPLLLRPIDFAELLRQQQAARAPAGRPDDRLSHPFGEPERRLELGEKERVAASSAALGGVRPRRRGAARAPRRAGSLAPSAARSSPGCRPPTSSR